MRQLVSVVFERVVAEDAKYFKEEKWEWQCSLMYWRNVDVNFSRIFNNVIIIVLVKKLLSDKTWERLGLAQADLLIDWDIDITLEAWFHLVGVPSNAEEEVEEHINLEELKVLSANSPKTLRPAAADAYLMFQVCKVFIMLQWSLLLQIQKIVQSLL